MITPEPGTNHHLLLESTVIGDPLGKGRPKFARMGQFVRAYTDKKTVSWEHNASVIFGEDWHGRPMLEGVPLALEVTAIGARPKRLLRAKDPPGRLWRPAKPDGDNVIKIVADSLVKGAVIRDDILIVRWEITCLYAAKDEGPKVYVALFQLDPYENR